MKTIIWNKATAKQRKEALARPLPSDTGSLVEKVQTILNEVKLRGDAAVCEFTAKFDGTAKNNTRVPQKEIDSAETKLDKKLLAALKRAKSNIEKFHKAELPKATLVETMPGVKCALMWRPVETVGLYIPAGTAPLFSALLMLAIPAQIAGCKNIVLCSPPQRTTGKVHPAVLAAAKLCDVTNFFAVGGAQAIAAMAYGTRTIPKVDKIFGPGNTFVTLAKQLVSQDPAGASIDMPAGPSEVLVIADAKANPAYAAADLLAQAEHDPTAQAIFITTSPEMAKQVNAEVDRQIADLPRRDIAQKALTHSRIIVVNTMDEAIEVSNAYAPEHLIILQRDAAKLLPKITHAGSVFLGELTPEPAGDYASGTNHVLPTYGYARSYGGVSIYSFLKTMTAQSLTPEGLRRLGPSLITMAEAEGLQGHANAVKLRMEKAQ